MERTSRETRCRPDFPAPLVCAERRAHCLIRCYHRTCGEHKRAMTTTEHRGGSQPSQVLQRTTIDHLSQGTPVTTTFPCLAQHPPILFRTLTLVTRLAEDAISSERRGSDEQESSFLLTPQYRLKPTDDGFDPLVCLSWPRYCGSTAPTVL
jgi:hypothetical protein